MSPEHVHELLLYSSIQPQPWEPYLLGRRALYALGMLSFQESRTSMLVAVACQRVLLSIYPTAVSQGGSEESIVEQYLRYAVHGSLQTTLRARLPSDNQLDVFQLCDCLQTAITLA